MKLFYQKMRLHSKGGKKLSTQITKKDFEKIYQETYQHTLRFIIVKCNNIEDVNDILQDTYMELLKVIKKKKALEIEHINSYIMGIANNIIKRYYHKKKKDNIVSYYAENNQNSEAEDSFDLEQDIMTKENVKEVWKYVKNKDLTTTKIFYLYFAMGLKISEIAKELELTESNVKNKIYRTLKELKKYLGKEVISDD